MELNVLKLNVVSSMEDREGAVEGAEYIDEGLGGRGVQDLGCDCGFGCCCGGGGHSCRRCRRVDCGVGFDLPGCGEASWA